MFCAKQVGERFARSRRAAGKTTTQVGDAVGCSASTISHIEAGRRRPGLALAVRIHRLMKSWPGGAIQPEEWLEGTTEHEAA